MTQKVVNYDGYDYDYSTYWKGREYENNAEHIVLENFLKKEKGNWFIDIGGSYGRLAEGYADKFKHCVILDYSLKTLQKNHKNITNRFPNCILIAGNAYNMPFKENVFDGGLMVRVLHHIERQKDYFEELSRILKEDGIYIQEFANKIHIKARIKAFLARDKSIKDRKPYQQPTIHLEGAKGDGVSFLNYHPEYIENLLEDTGFDIEKKQGCSYLRIPILKKVFGSKILLFFEKIFQKLFAKADISPSIFLKTELDKGEEGDKYEQLEDILACPSCKSRLEFENDIAICTNCGEKYIKKEGVWDFRTK
jgi:ubiquinone/menaquinone biosynthesis C-methylase UbiE